MQVSATESHRDNSLVGFFNNPKRFNVAVTRAQALLVVLGHPAMLKQDAHWRALVRTLPARQLLPRRLACAQQCCLMHSACMSHQAWCEA